MTTQSVMAQNMPRQAVGAGRDASKEARAADDEDPCIDIDDHRTCWSLDPITGIRYYQVPDTSYLNIAAHETMEGKSLGLLYTGNLYSPHLITNQFDRREAHDYLFINAYSLFAYRPADLWYYDTKLPYTTAAYTTSGTNLHTNDRLRLSFAGNINHKLGIGTFLDYVYARGEYISQATKPLKWTSYVYYNDDQYKAALSFNISKLANQENGGIQDRDWVLKPDNYSNNAFLTDPATMPTNLRSTWNDMDGVNLHLNHSYDLGFWDEYTNPEDTTEVLDHFTSVASIFHSLDFESYDHQFRMDANADQTEQKNFFHDRFFPKSTTTLDSTSYSSFSTYAGIRLNEGFNKWSQFGLSAFIGYQHQNYTMMQDTLDYDFIPRRHSSNNIFIGGQISRHLSSLLSFDATARFGILGDKKGDVDISGQMQTVIPAGRNDSITVQASGYFRNTHNSWLMEHYFSNHFKWNEKFAAERRTRIQGKFHYSFTGTEAKVGIENISNYHYFSAEDFLPHECKEQIQVFSAEFSQKLHWRGIHWDNRLLIQTTTNDEDNVLPLPHFAVESDLSLRFVIAHALTTQLGITGYYYSKYYAPTYQPATQQFAVQHDIKCGNYPLFNAYVNCNLKKLKFFIMYSNIGTDLISTDAFLMPNYPLQSSRLQYGVIFDLQN